MDQDHQLHGGLCLGVKNSGRFFLSVQLAAKLTPHQRHNPLHSILHLRHNGLLVVILAFCGI